MIYITRHGETDWNIIDKLQGRNDIEKIIEEIENAQKDQGKEGKNDPGNGDDDEKCKIFFQNLLHFSKVYGIISVACYEHGN